MTTLNFPPIYIEDAVASPVTTYTRRVDIYESDGVTLWHRGVPLEGGSITIDMSRAERRTASLKLYSENDLLRTDRENGFWYDKVIKVYMGVNSASGNWETCVGTFLMDVNGSKNYSRELEVNCRDFAKKLSYPIAFPVGWAVNTPIEIIVRDLAQGGGIPLSKINVPTTGLFIDEERTISSGTTRWSAAYDIATAYGYDLYFDANGVLQMDAFTDPATSLPQYTFRVGVDSNISEIDRSISDTLIRNHVAVEGEAPNGVPVWGEAYNNEPTSPTRIERLGIRTKGPIKNSWVVTNAQATEVAQRELKYSSLEKYEANLKTVLIPWLDVNITANFDDPMAAPGDPTRYLVSKLEFDLNLGAASALLARVTSVFNAQPIYPATNVYPAPGTFPSNS